MKKLFLAFAVASIFAACDDSSKTESTISDSTNVKVDSSAVTAPVDTTTTVDTSANKMSSDTTHK
jgi:hypothetical protein